MSTQELDAERRILLPEGRPGEVFEIRPQGEGRFLLVRVEEAAPKRPKTKEEVRRAIEESPIEFTMSWEELRKITREP